MINYKFAIIIETEEGYNIYLFKKYKTIKFGSPSIICKELTDDTYEIIDNVNENKDIKVESVGEYLEKNYGLNTDSFKISLNFMFRRVDSVWVIFNKKYLPKEWAASIYSRYTNRLCFDNIDMCLKNYLKYPVSLANNLVIGTLGESLPFEYKIEYRNTSIDDSFYCCLRYDNRNTVFNYINKGVYDPIEFWVNITNSYVVDDENEKLIIKF